MTSDRDMAHAIWRAADRLRDEARQLREDAAGLDAKAKELDDLACALSDGRSLRGAA
jgi:hypothetical protein